MTSRTFTFSVSAPSGAPSWFAALPEKQWTARAGGSTETVIFARDNPPQLTINGSGLNAIGQAYNGAVVDQATGEYLWVANGGHDDYRGNEAYAINLRSESPRWYRIHDRSPASVILYPAGTNSISNLPSGQGTTPRQFRRVHQDGRMPAQHGWHSNIFANGKCWFPTQQSPTGIGGSTNHAWMWDRYRSGHATAPGQTPAAWSNDAGPYTWLGTSGVGLKGDFDLGPSTSSLAAGSPAAYDPVTGLVWCVAQDYLGRWFSINTQTLEMRTGTRSSPPDIESDWAAVVRDPVSDRWRFLVASDRLNSRLLVLNLKAADSYAYASWSFVPISDPVAVRDKMGAVYHAPSRSILLYDAQFFTAGEIIKLRVPTDGAGDYAGGTWQVSTIAAAAGSANPRDGVVTNPGSSAFGGAATWSKFNIIEDMGNGQSALVVCMGCQLPTYVYKLPTTEIF